MGLRLNSATLLAFAASFLLLASLCAGIRFDDSHALIPKDANTVPQQIHLAFAGNETTGPAMTVSWFTADATETSTVLYGTDANDLNLVATGYTTTYYESFIHHVIIDGLEPLTQYFYQCGDKLGGFSTTFHFTTQPAYGSQTPFKTAVYGDMGVTQSEDTMQQLFQLGDLVDFHYQVGDYGYSDDNPQKDFEEIWNEFQNEIQNYTAYKAFMTCPGNHEASCHSYGNFFCHHDIKNFTAYRHRFRMPAEESGSPAGPMFYSFDYSFVHFVSLSTETDYEGAPEGRGTLWNAGPFGNQLAWLESDLQAATANRAVRPWIIVIGHRPFYSTTYEDFPPFIRDFTRKAFEDLLYKYNVDLYISGHVHGYERMYPMYKGVAEQKNYDNPRSPTYIVIGNAGNIEGHEKHWDKETKDYLAIRNEDDYGYAILDVANSTTLTWTMHRATDNSVADYFVLNREH